MFCYTGSDVPSIQGASPIMVTRSKTAATTSEPDYSTPPPPPEKATETMPELSTDLFDKIPGGRGRRTTPFHTLVSEHLENPNRLVLAPEGLSENAKTFDGYGDEELDASKYQAKLRNAAKNAGKKLEWKQIPEHTPAGHPLHAYRGRFAWKLSDLKK